MLEERLQKHIDLLIKRYPALSTIQTEITDAYLIMEECYKNGGKLMIAGNGGSAADAEHIAGELMKRFKTPRPVSREFAEKYHLDAVFTNLEAFAASDAFDAAYIASPNICHFEQAMCLLRHGKHVLLEKPGVLTRKQTEALVETAKAHHVVYLEAMRLVFDDALPIIRDALPEIGTLRRVTAEFTQYSSRYDRVRAGEPHINAFDPALCNAAILDMGCYPIHALISMFGEPAHVSAEAYHLESGFEAGGIALLRYDGFVCEAIWSKVCKQAAPTTFMGEDGSILLDDINHIRRIWLVRRSGETVELPYREKLPNNMMYELREFAGYIASGTQPEKRNRNSILTAAVIEEARRQTGTILGGI